MHQKNVTYVIIGILKMLIINMNHIFAMVCLEKPMNFNDVAIVSIKENDFRIHFWYMSKGDAINIMKHSNLNKKVDYYNSFLV